MMHKSEVNTLLNPMIMKIPIVVIALFSIFISSCASIPEPAKEELINAKPYPFDYCLVIELPFKDSKRIYTKVYKGQIVKFCCKSCYIAFDEHPDLFLQKIKQAK